MNDNSDLWSMKPFRHQKGVPDIPTKSKPEVPTDWTDEIERLEKFFAGVALPVGRFKINAWTTTLDLAGTIESGMNILKANNGNRTFHSCLEQLQEIELLLLPEQERDARKVETTPKPLLIEKKKAKRVKRLNAKLSSNDIFVL